MTGGRRWHPWRALQRRPDIEVVFADPGPGMLGRIDYETGTIYLHPRLMQDERRSTLTHELVHLERGPAVIGGEAREEAVVEREAARRLIELAQLMRAVQWTDDPHELALELWVDVDTVMVRLRHLPAHEHAELVAVAASRDGEHQEHDDQVETTG